MWLAAAAVALLFFLVYHATMLRGVDLGDTPSFQTMGGSAFISPRDAYPLYFALSAPMVWWTGNPAAGMNLASVVFAALACGAIVVLAAQLTGSTMAGVAAALVFGASFTFWSQAIIAEVYALHLLCLAVVLGAALAWEARPTTTRLAILFLAYAISFGNHLTMVIWMPALAVFLLASAPGGPRAWLGPRIVLLALACALIGAAQYGWPLRTLLNDPIAPANLRDVARWFWFDVTKADWRDTMVLEVPGMMATERARMFAFDLHQQFGWWPVGAAAAGAVVLAARAPRRFLLLFLGYLATLVFALTYNVGDTHVFLLPAHLVVALLIAPALAAIPIPRVRHAALALTIAFAVVRVYDEYPALDRSGDRRAREAFARVTQGLTATRAVLFGDLEWQLGNGLNYYAAHETGDVVLARAADILPYAPTLVADNLAIGREVVVTARARQLLETSYGFLYAFEPDVRVELPRLSSQVEQMAAGTPYVVTRIKPATVVGRVEEPPGGPGDEAQTLTTLTGGRLRAWPAGDYVAIAGVVGEAPVDVIHDDRPFTSDLQLGQLPVRIRMDAWLAFDTIRRMGFGQVVAGRHHALILERGVSLVGLGADGVPRLTAYANGLYAPQPRYRLTIRD